MTTRLIDPFEVNLKSMDTTIAGASLHMITCILSESVLTQVCSFSSTIPTADSELMSNLKVMSV